MPRRFNNNRRSNRPRRRRRINRRPVDPNMGPMLLATNNKAIPRHIFNPRVTRIVRLNQLLTTASPNYTVTYLLVSTQDFNDYSVSAARYTEMRCLSIRVYMNVYLATLATPSLGLTLTDSSSGVEFDADPVSGSSLPSVGYLYPFAVRSFIAAVSDTTALTVITTDTTAVPATGNIRVTIDVTTEFQ